VPAELAAVLVAKAVRTFGYGALGVVLPVHLSALGLGAPAIGVAVTLVLAGSAALTWAVRRPAERWGARAGLGGLAGLAVVAGVLLLSAADPWVVVAGAVLGNVAVGTGETGPFLALEQVVIARAVPAARRTAALGVYNLLGYGAGALGAAAVALVDTPEPLFAAFLAGAVVQLLAYRFVPAGRPPSPGPRARAAGPLIRRLAALFALDAFAGGFVLQSLVAYFLHARFGLEPTALGLTFFGAQILTAASLLLAAPLSARFGLLPTMVVSHLASNVLLVAIAVAPTAAAAVALLLGRHLLSQIDVPTRQAYVMALVPDAEREAAAAGTTLARTVAQAVTPALTGWAMQALGLGAPFVLGGGLKIAYDLLLYASFRGVPVREG